MSSRGRRWRNLYHDCKLKAGRVGSSWGKPRQRFAVGSSPRAGRCALYSPVFDSIRIRRCPGRHVGLARPRSSAVQLECSLPRPFRSNIAGCSECSRREALVRTPAWALAWGTCSNLAVSCWRAPACMSSAIAFAGSPESPSFGPWTPSRSRTRAVSGCWLGKSERKRPLLCHLGVTWYFHGTCLATRKGSCRWTCTIASFECACR